MEGRAKPRTLTDVYVEDTIATVKTYSKKAAGVPLSAYTGVLFLAIAVLPEEVTTSLAIAGAAGSLAKIIYDAGGKKSYDAGVQAIKYAAGKAMTLLPPPRPQPVIDPEVQDEKNQALRNRKKMS